MKHPGPNGARGESYRNTEKLHTRIFRIGGLPINDWSAQMVSSIFDEGHQRLVALLIDARKRSGLKQAELGRRVGRSQSFISLIERSQRRVDVVEFIALSRAMGQDAEAIFKALVQAQATPN